MAHGIDLSGLHRLKSLRKTIGAILVAMAMLGALPAIALAQGDQLSQEAWEVVRDISRLSRQTTLALRRDGQVKKQKLAKQVLENRPPEPLNRNKFMPAIYPETPPTVPAEGPVPTEEEVAIMLQDYLAQDCPNHPGIQRMGMRLFAHPLVKEKIPNPSLRAALLGLGRTIAVDAIPFILLAKTSEGLPKVKEIKFDDQNQLPEQAVAASVGDNTTGQLTFIFNPKYQAENPFLFTRVMAHEPLHSDFLLSDPN
jgi:hypothetical protein